MLGRITAAPSILVGKSCVKGTRLSAALTVDFARSAERRDDTVEAYPHLRLEVVEHPVCRATESLQGDAVLTREVDA